MGKYKKRTGEGVRRLMGSDYVGALKETFFIWAISTLAPVTILWFIGALIGNSNYSSISGFSFSFGKFFVPTEIFVYTTTILAPSIAFMIFNWRARIHSGWYRLLGFAIIVAMMLTAIVYSLSKAGVDLDDKFVFTSSIIFYITAIVIWYLTKVFEKKLPKIGKKPAQSGDGILEDL